MRNIEKYKDIVLDNVDACIIDEYLHRMNVSAYCEGYNCEGCKERFLKWLLEECKEPVLEDAERKYLSEVIRPFRNEVTYIKKDCTDKYFIVIAMKHDCAIYLPTFPVDSSMYKGMKVGEKYKLEELGL